MSTINKVVRVLRGASWSYTPGDLRSTIRIRNKPSLHDYDFGFRLIRRSHAYN